jgi:hypothetical protein
MPEVDKEEVEESVMSEGTRNEKDYLSSELFELLQETKLIY